MEAEKLAPQNDPLADALASKVDLYDLVPEIKQKRTSSIYLKNNNTAVHCTIPLDNIRSEVESINCFLRCRVLTHTNGTLCCSLKQTNVFQSHNQKFRKLQQQNTIS